MFSNGLQPFSTAKDDRTQVGFADFSPSSTVVLAVEE
jgi:hypothetical protein